MPISDAFYCTILLNSQKRNADSAAAVGSVRNQARAMLRMVRYCRPLPLAVIAPAMPELTTWVVETGRPRPVAPRMVSMETKSEQAPWP